MKFTHCCCAIALGALAPYPQAIAQNASETSVISQVEELDILNQLQELRENQEQLQLENQRLREQIERLQERLPADEPLAEEPSDPPQEAAEIETEKSPRVGFNPGGGGFFIEGEKYRFRILGYTQALYSRFDEDLDRSDGSGDFSIRRARVDFLADFFDDYQLLIEIEGAASTTVVSTDSDFGLIEARLNWEVAENDLQLRTGKFTTPFSTENFRSSRSIDTIERYIALNSLFLLPAVDVQFGAMLHGQLGESDRFGYFAGVFNGNGSASTNFSDNNDSKEVQLRLNYQFRPSLGAGIAFDYSIEEPQTLTLADLSFSSYVSVPIEGERLGFNADVFWEKNRWSFRSEGLAFLFDSPSGETVGLYGGFVQPAYFITGNSSQGLQALVRGEVAHIDGDTGDNGDTLWAVTAGVNWFINPNVRLQVNGILHFFDGPSEILGFDDNSVVPLLLTELQFKF